MKIFFNSEGNGRKRIQNNMSAHFQTDLHYERIHIQGSEGLDVSSLKNIYVLLEQEAKKRANT